MIIEEAVAAFNDSAPSAMGIMTEPKQLETTVSETPCPSFPITILSEGINSNEPKARESECRCVQNTLFPINRCLSIKSQMFSITENSDLKMLPIPLLSVLGLYMSAHLSDIIIFLPPRLYAHLKTAPRF